MSSGEQELSGHFPAESVVVAEADVVPHEDSRPLRDTVREMAYELVEYRDLLLQLTLRDIRIRYKQAVMGFGWAILMPMLIVGAGVLIKYALVQMGGTELKAGSLAGMAVKALPWAFFVGAIGFATNSLTGNINLVTKIYFPREVFPLSAVLAQAFDTMIGSAIVAGLIFLFFRIGLSTQILWAIPLAVLLFLLTAGAALFLSCANLFFRDVKYIVQVLLTFGIFFTPVFYEAANLGPQGCTLMMLNPLAPLLEGFRLAVVEHHNLLHSLVVTSPAGQEVLAWHPWYVAYAAAWALLGCLAAWLMFHKLESVYAEYI
jgi:ABC-type polysaccharide/polyol phosphate export permease